MWEEEVLKVSTRVVKLIQAEHNRQPDARASFTYLIARSELSVTNEKPKFIENSTTASLALL